MCNCCNNCCIHKVTSATADTTALTLAFSPAVGANDKQRFCFVICTTLPNMASPLPVQLTVNGATVPLLNKYGNVVYSNAIKTRKVYRGYFGSETTAHVIALNTPCDDCCNN